MKHKFLTRLLLLALVALLTCSLLTLGAYAAEPEQTAATESTEQADSEQRRNPTNEELGGFFSAERIKYAVLVTGVGMLMIFCVLGILWGVVSLMKVFMHDIPEKRRAKKKALASAVAQVAQPEPAVVAVPEEDEGEIVAAITAAIAAVLESEEYAGEFASGFRVVSFSRKGGAWNQHD